MKFKLLCFIFLLSFGLTTGAWAEEIYFKNGDRLTGVITHEDDTSITLKILGATEFVIDKSFVDMPKTYPQKYPLPPPGPQWQRSFALGYTKTLGNTNKTQGTLSTNINRKTPTNEATLKFDTLYSKTDTKIDAKKFYGMLRYAHSFGTNLKWYNFYKLEGDQDRFTQIDYRLTPSMGRGYWFSNTDNLKLMTEVAIGYEYTNYRTEIKSKGQTVLVPRFFIDKRLINHIHLSEDFTFYPSISNITQYRYRSETALVNQITERWFFNIKFTDDFDSDPVAAKKNDYTWITSLEYKF